ncbi:MAG TPA: thioredoxin domain-containing protein [Vicinamibacterales bacterium]|nr:thioredoxin domain-containing protein [Vicinamibacterales bacterium]
MKHRPLVVGLFVLFLPASAPSLAQQPGEKLSAEERLQRIEKTLQTLSGQLEELTTRLRPQQQVAASEALAPGLDLTLAGAPRRGSRTSKLMLIEFSDFQCPFCARHARGAYEQIQREYVNSGKVQYAFRHFPLEHIHPLARQAAEAAVCADEQGRFWEFHDRLLLNQQALAKENLKTHAADVHVDSAKFDTCLAKPQTAARVTQDVSDARRLGLRATPAFIIGELQEGGTVRALHRIVGARPFEVFKTALDALIVADP